MSLIQTMHIALAELELELSFSWNHLEYPQIGDSISIVGLCSEVQKSELKKMPLPRHVMPNDFLNVLEYITHHIWIVTHRSWGYSDSIEITCTPYDPLL